jgi:hypothetical protein
MFAGKEPYAKVINRMKGAGDGPEIANPRAVRFGISAQCETLSSPYRRL